MDGAAEEPRRGGRGGGKGGGKADPASLGLPKFVRTRHYVRGANVFAVPLWDLTSGWVPEELKSLASASRGSRSAPSGATAESGDAPFKPPPRKARDDEDGEDGDGDEGDAGAPGEGEDAEASDSEQSEIGWEGPLGGESRVWSRASLDGALLLLRRTFASSEGGLAYSIAISAALFPPDSITEGADALLDRRLVDVTRTREPCWAVCALRSGHFAGAIFRGSEAVIHKTIHRYTVRARAGGAQSSADSGKKIKSAGSNLRRYGEQRLSEEIREIMTDKWAKELAACELIFVSVSPRMKSTLLGKDAESFVQMSKVRKLPFMVGKPTFEAVQQAYLRVASVVFTDEQTAEAMTAQFRKPAAKAHEAPPAVEATPKEEPAQVEAEKPAPRPKYVEEEDELFSALHKAASAGDEEQITELLDGGADPTARDGKGRVPFYLCNAQRTRDAFRRWRGTNEDAWDWVQAQVPEGINDESEQRKKDKEKEKKKKQKEKQKANKAQAMVEAEEAKKKEEEEARVMEAAQTKCDSCKKPVLGKPFSRLNFFYCSPECVNNHRRELQAEAALKRFGG